MMVPDTIPRATSPSDWAYVARWCNHTKHPNLAPDVVLIDDTAMEGSGGGPVAIITSQDLVAMDQATYYAQRPDGDDYSKFIAMGITHRVATEEEIEDGGPIYVPLAPAEPEAPEHFELYLDITEDFSPEGDDIGSFLERRANELLDVAAKLKSEPSDGMQDPYAYLKPTGWKIRGEW